MPKQRSQIMFNHSLGALLKGLSLPVRIKYLPLLPRQPTGAESCNTLQKPALKPSPPDGITAPTEELEVTQRKGTTTWEVSSSLTLRGGSGRNETPKPAEQDFEAVLYLRQVPRSMGCKLGLFSLPSDSSAGAALPH